MNFLQWFQQHINHDAPHYKLFTLPSSQVRTSDGTAADSQTLEADRHYFQLFLAEMYLKSNVQWFKTWYPAVHSAVTLNFGNKQETLVHIAGSSRLKDIEQNLDKVITLNHALTPLLPFKGGTVALDAGMLAMEGSNAVKSMIEVLGSFSKLLMVPQLSAALDVAGPLADGAAQLLGATNGRLVLGLHTEWTGAGPGAGDNVLRAGYFATVLADTQVLRDNRFWVVNDHLHYGETAETSQPFSGYDYMLFRLERRDQRDDFASLTSIQDPFTQAIKMIEANNVSQAEMFKRAAIVAAFSSPDLTAMVDRRRVIEQLKLRYDEARELLAQGASIETVTSLNDAMAGAMSPESAFALGPLLGVDQGNEDDEL